MLDAPAPSTDPVADLVLDAPTPSTDPVADLVLDAPAPSNEDVAAAETQALTDALVLNLPTEPATQAPAEQVAETGLADAVEITEDLIVADVAPQPTFVVEPAPSLVAEAWPTDGVWSRPVVTPDVDITADLAALLSPATNPSTQELLAEIEELELLAQLPQPTDLLANLGDLNLTGDQPTWTDVLTPAPQAADVNRTSQTALTLPGVDVAIVYEAAVPPAPVKAAESNSLSKSWSVVLPYEDLFQVNAGETRIFAVNEVSVNSLEEFHAAVQSTVDDTTSESVTLEVLMGTTEADTRTQNWSLPVVQSLKLSSGLTFEVSAENGTWVTRVVEVPSDYTQAIQPGDVIFGYIPTSELLETRNGLYDILDREIANNTTQFSFAVKRGRATWVINFDYDPKKYASNN